MYYYSLSELHFAVETHGCEAPSIRADKISELPDLSYSCSHCNGNWRMEERYLTAIISDTQAREMYYKHYDNGTLAAVLEDHCKFHNRLSKKKPPMKINLAPKKKLRENLLATIKTLDNVIADQSKEIEELREQLKDAQSSKNHADQYKTLDWLLDNCQYNEKVEDDLRERMKQIWEQLTEEERADIIKMWVGKAKQKMLFGAPDAQMPTKPVMASFPDSATLSPLDNFRLISSVLEQLRAAGILSIDVLDAMLNQSDYYWEMLSVDDRRMLEDEYAEKIRDVTGFNFADAKKSVYVEREENVVDVGEAVAAEDSGSSLLKTAGLASAVVLTVGLLDSLLKGGKQEKAATAVKEERCEKLV